MFIPVSSSTLLAALDRSLPLLSSAYRDAYHSSDPSVSRVMTPEQFDRVLNDIVVLNRRDAGVGGIVQAAPAERATITAATPVILALVSRWSGDQGADAAAWELAVAATPARGDSAAA